ncbi:MAG TPA: DUF3857 and transglutaminase domain-containing protein [Candidatus Sulfotelmatobacter sp.]|nr:DUF3857 and transglutaminase domain-containing protein [Candidatus Sulfotelmatobacter sp.]
MPVINRFFPRAAMAAIVWLLLGAQLGWAGDAPAWMHAAATATLPAHDEKTDAVLLYSEHNINVQSADKVKVQYRVAYKILRPGGREYSFASVAFHPHEKVNYLRGWCIPAQGKDYEVKDKEALEMALPKIEGSELVSDVRRKVIQIPAADPGNIIGYEYETEEQPLLLQSVWSFQQEIPVRETHFSLQLPSGWAYKANWINYPEVKPSESGSQLQWTVSDVKAIRREAEMPPFDGISGQMVVSYFPQGNPNGRIFTNWKEMGTWYTNLTEGRRDATPDIKQEVAALTASANTPLAKMKAIAQFVQHDIRYVAIELGIGGFQPHSAAEVFAHRYGDCKDKATLMSAMLSQAGIDSFYVVINAERGSVTAATPATAYVFDHAVLAIKLPDGLTDPSLVSKVQHPSLGPLLFFDPTNELTPFGQIGGYLQSNYGLLVGPQGGELVQLPMQPVTMNGIERTGKLTLDSTGTLKGEMSETRIGDRAWSERWRLRTVTKNTDRIKPIEDLLAGSLSLFRITQASIINMTQTDLPFGFHYTFEAQNYAKDAGGLLLVRPRVLGVKTLGFLETKEPRNFPIEFDGPVHDTDTFEIAIPSGYSVDDVPPPVDVDYSFASYHAKTEVRGNLIHYSRTFEVKELSVPVAHADDLKKFYRIIASDERNTVVLKAQGK